MKRGNKIKIKKGAPGKPALKDAAAGIYQGNERGFGFFIPEGGGEDVFIPAGASGGAVHGDKVLVRAQNSGRRSREGRVLKILSRANSALVGIYGGGYLIPDDRRIPYAVKIKNREAEGLKEGCKAVAAVHKWGKGSIEGEIIKVLTGEGIEGEISSILYKHGFDTEFPPKVKKEADSFAAETDFTNRLDLRDALIITIDGADAKDFDDAISLEKTPSGYRLGVHIADVSHYVKERSALDREAYARGTSCYLPGRTAHMLPQSLSNGLCSLMPNEDRLAISIIMDIGAGGEVLEHRAALSVIRSRERMTYDDVSRLLEPGAPAELKNKYGHILKLLNDMKALSQILRKRRAARGALNFDLPEPEIILNESGEPISVKVTRFDVAHGIIEEFMLLCNETVAGRIAKAKLPFIYRVHESADEEKIEKFSVMLHNLGYRLKVRPSAKNLQEILEKVKGKPHEKMVIMLMLRSMMKARYAPENLGHFGLAAQFYCHFTSPIRRYPDLVCHRVLKKHIAGGFGRGDIAALRAFTAKASVSASNREEAAAQAENEAIEFMLCEYMKGFVGEEFPGIIASLTRFGFFVELDNTVEGLVRLENISDDFYEFDEAKMEIKGARGGRVFKIGDDITVMVKAVNPALRQIDFLPAGGGAHGVN